MAYKVSVIIPFYNSEKTIGRCAESLFAQTLADIEYIFIDDGSSDSSVSVLRNVLVKHEERRNDVVLVSEPVNKGQAAARKRGVEMASGDYIIYCDSDDYNEPEMYGTMYNMACRGYDIVECGYWMEMVNGERQKWQFDKTLYHDREKMISELLLDKGLSSLWNKLVSLDLYRKVEFPSADIYEDFAITVQLYIHAGKIAYIDRLFYHYVKNTGSTLLPITEEKYRYTRKSRISNVGFICGIIESAFPKELYKRQLEKLKYDAKNYWLADKTYSCRKEWLDTFPKIFPSVLFNPFVVLRGKVVAIGRYSLYKCFPVLFK